MDSIRIINEKMSEIRSRYTGKDPFGPWTDLNQLFYSLNENDKTTMKSILAKKQKDSFWKDFIEMFLKENKIEL